MRRKRVKRMGTIRRIELLDVMRFVYTGPFLSLDFDIHEQAYEVMHDVIMAQMVKTRAFLMEL